MRADLFLISGQALTVAVFAVLAVLLRPATANWRSPERRLWLAIIATTIWAAVDLWQLLDPAVAPWLPMVCESLMLAAWGWMLGAALALTTGNALLARLAAWSSALAVPAVIASALTPSRANVAIVLIVLATVLLLAIENVVRNSTSEARPATRLLALGIGGIAALTLLNNASFALFGEPEAWLHVTRSYVSAACGACLALAARRMPSWSVGLFVSRQVAFYATSAVLVGAYLLIASVGSWALAQRAGDWLRPALLVFSAMAVIALAALLGSRPLRQRLRVFLSKHFYRNRYDYRLEWLRFISTLSTATDADTVPATAMRAVAQIVGSPGAQLWLLDRESRQFAPVDSWRMDSGAPSTALVRDEQPVAEEAALPRYLRDSGWLIDFQELAARAQLYSGLEEGERTRLAETHRGLLVPLLHVEQLVGWMLLERPASLGTLTFEDRDLLKIAGRQVAVHLAQVDSDRRLAMARQFEAYNRMTAFVMHDLRNLLAQLNLIAQNATRHRRNPDFVDDAMSTISHSADRISKLLAQLRQGDATGELRRFDLAQLIERSLLRLGSRNPVPAFECREFPIVDADPERLAAVFEHAVRNAQDATAESGAIAVAVGFRERRAYIEIADTGVGMSDEFVRERLFRPFDSTKGSRGMGIGAFQIREYMRSIGGDVQVNSQPGVGTRFLMLFPVKEAAEIRQSA
ncbi:MAG: PEP-CTERM system histidine kinase PrsK [Steroidobacteraceae bacterium]